MYRIYTNQVLLLILLLICSSCENKTSIQNKPESNGTSHVRCVREEFNRNIKMIGELFWLDSLNMPFSLAQNNIQINSYSHQELKEGMNLRVRDLLTTYQNENCFITLALIGYSMPDCLQPHPGTCVFWIVSDADVLLSSGLITNQEDSQIIVDDSYTQKIWNDYNLMMSDFYRDKE